MPAPSTAAVRTLALAGFVLLSAGPARAADEPADGLFVTVPNPITDFARTEIENAIDKARAEKGRNVKTVVFDFNPDGKDAATENPGVCSNLAEMIRRLRDNGVMPVAFVHGKVIRDAVLPVVACEELVMSSGAEIGDVATGDRPVPEKTRVEYAGMAGPRKAAIVLKMLDKSIQIVEGKLDGAVIYVDRARLDEPAYKAVHVPDKGKVLDVPQRLTTQQALKFNLCQRVCETRQEVAEFYRLPASALNGDRFRGQPKACRIVVNGPINAALADKLRRQVESAKAKKENVFFFVLQTRAGDPKSAEELANYIEKLGTDEANPVRTVAYVGENVPDLALYLALACNEIVMYRGPDASKEAVLGDFDQYVQAMKGVPAEPRKVEGMRTQLTAHAARLGIPAIVIDGMFEKTLVIVEASNEKTGEKKLMSEADFKRAQADDKAWVNPVRLKNENQTLKLTATLAKNLRAAKTVDNNNVDEVFAQYGFDPKAVRWPSRRGWTTSPPSCAAKRWPRSW